MKKNIINMPDFKVIQLTNSQAIKLAAIAFNDLTILSNYEDYEFWQDQNCKTTFIIDAVHSTLSRVSHRIENYYL